MSALMTVPFHGANLMLVEHDGQPFVPMKPVVEGMGLSWAAQTVKLNSNKARWGVSIIEIPSASGIQSYLCLPLRKLVGWLSTIHPSKVRADLREEITAYQNECDDALWAYWNDGVAVNPRSNGLTPAQQRHVQQRVAELANGNRAKFATIYRSIKDQFMVGSYKDVAEAKYPALCQVLMCKPLEGELLDKEALEPDEFRLTKRQAEWVVCLIHSADWVSAKWSQGIGDGVKALNPRLYSSTFEHFDGLQLAAQTLDVELASLVQRLRRDEVRPSECAPRACR